ncbi:putative woronin body major protein [Venturia nashicola]|uniref:Putative woronin body major protein n=1 Tax=Venturia nashicola TaxID=86259 RepID=A0A4Z1PE54_9PEZI|nr:putative woronin body major protein [Venturia nashicola]
MLIAHQLSTFSSLDENLTATSTSIPIFFGHPHRSQEVLSCLNKKEPPPAIWTSTPGYRVRQPVLHLALTSDETRRAVANQVASIVPFSVFPSSYRSDAAVTATEKNKSTKVEGEIELEKGREGHSETRYTTASSERKGKKVYEEDVRISENRPQQYRREEHIHITEREREPERYIEAKHQFEDKHQIEPKGHFERKHQFEDKHQFVSTGHFERKHQVDQEQRFEQQPREQIERTERVEHVEISQNPRERYQEPYSRYVDAQIDVQDKTLTTKDRTYDREGRPIGGPAPAFEATLDATERQFRQGTSPIVVAENRYGKEQRTAQDYFKEGSRFGGPTPDYPAEASETHYTQHSSRSTVDAPRYSQEEIRVEKTTGATIDPPKRDMGYYDDEGQYHSFRRGVQRVAERIAHPVHGPSLIRHEHHHKHPQSTHTKEVVVKDHEIQISAPRHTHVSSSHSTAPAKHASPPPHYASTHSVSHTHIPESHKMSTAATITIPCHHIRIGDLLMLQGRPCQVIRITTSSQTGQHRYLGVDLFTKQLHEESSFISHPSPSVVVQNMTGPVFKQYRVLDIRDDGRVVAMTETGDVKQGLPVIDQSDLLGRLSESFDNGRGSVRVLVINDGGKELAVDYKVVHGSRL